MKDRINTLLKLAETKENSSVSCAEHSFSESAQAENAFIYYRNKLLDLNHWNNHSEIMTFALFDEKGNFDAKGTLEKNKLIRLSLKGSGKDDWIKIIEILSEENEFIIKLKPTCDPTDADAEKALTSHFFTSESTNNICLLKEKEKIGLYVIGLDEHQNISETKNILETVRNVVTANAGFYLGIQKSEWTTFCKSFLNAYDSAEKS